jgi:hypothetical protein
MDKKIIFSGKNNRYQIKKLNGSEPLKNELRVNIEADKNICKKLYGYKSQDKKRGWTNNLELSDISVLLTDLDCYYCKNSVLLDYETKLHPMQWTLDRIDNDLPHNKDNVLLSCLKCNLERRRKNADHFLFTKSLKIVKI